MGKKILAGVSTVSNWTSIAGALEGVLVYLGEAHDRSTLMGLTGHAFRLSIWTSREGIADGESASRIDFDHAVRLYANLGYRVEHVSGRPEERDYGRRRDEAIKRIRRSIDRGLPAVVYGLQVPEFGLVKGYEDRAGLFYVSTTVSPQYGEALPLSQWPAPGHLEWVEAILLGDRRPVDRRAAEQMALAFAVELAEQGEPGPADTAHGYAAYQRWLEGYAEPGRLAAVGNARCIQVVQAARHDAARFLRDIARDYRVGVAALLKQAATAYDAETLAFSRLATLFPYPGGGDCESRGALTAGAGALRDAYTQERDAIQFIRQALRSV